MNTDDRIAEAPLVPPRAETDIEALRTTVTDLEQQARVLIKEQPVVAVLAAAGIGYLVARLLSRGAR